METCCRVFDNDPRAVASPFEPPGFGAEGNGDDAARSIFKTRKGGRSNINVKEKVKLICEAAQSRKADDIVVMDMAMASSLCEFFVVASASSTVRVKSVADAIEEAIEKKGVRVNHREGYAEGLWVLLDYSDVIVHIFHHQTRGFYNLESLWGDVPRQKFFNDKS